MKGEHAAKESEWRRSQTAGTGDVRGLTQMRENSIALWTLGCVQWREHAAEHAEAHAESACANSMQ